MAFKNKSTMVVATLFQLPQINGKFDAQIEGGRIVIHKDAKPTRSYVEHFNRSSENSGKIYVIDEAKTKQMVLDAKQLHAERKEAAAVLAEGGKAMSNFIKEATKPKP